MNIFTITLRIDGNEIEGHKRFAKPGEAAQAAHDALRALQTALGIADKRSSFSVNIVSTY